MNSKLNNVTRRIVSMLMALVIAFTMVITEKPKVKVQAAGPKLIAFTFDDGPSASQTGRLLDGLSARGAKATFFMNGTNGAHGVKNNMSLVRRMVSEGHQIANHTWSHITPFNKLGAGQISSEVAGVNEYLYDAMGGSFQTMVRIPGGATSSTISATVNSPMILWSVDPLDWKYRNANTVYNNIMNSASDGGIVLVHDLYGSSVDGALRAISSLQAQGYECVTVAELFRRRGVTPNNGSTYSKVGVTGVNLPAYSAPAITANMDNYANVTVTINNSNDGTTIHYTTDGSEPGFNSPVWSGSMKVTSNMTIKAVGYDKYGTRTPTASKSFTAGEYFVTFDAKFYADKYPDLKQAFGYDTNQLWNHYLNCGLAEGRQGSAIFSLSYYKDANPDLVKAFGNNNLQYLRHFALHGMKEGRVASSNFDVKSYKMQYPDLRQNFGSDMTKYFTHYLKHGYQEKRTGTGCEEVVKATTVYNGVDYSKVYDYYYYINKYPDIKKYFSKDDITTLKHFVEHGMAEGRQAISSFDVRAYRNNYPDLNKNFGNDWKKYFVHYMNHGYKEKRSAVGTEVSNPVTVYRGVDYSAVYDFNYYINKYPDMYKYYAKNDVGALKHFVEHGMAEGRQGCAAFNVQVYRSKNPDLNGHFGNNLKKYYIHYKDHGKNENRVSAANKVDKPITVYNGVDYSKVYDFNYYINKYPDMKKYYGNNDVAALKHFVYHGMAEGRQAKANFDPKAYRANYADLNGYFGNDYVKYYIHYMNHGIYEGRKGN